MSLNMTLLALAASRLAILQQSARVLRDMQNVQSENTFGFGPQVGLTFFGSDNLPPILAEL
jgi:hypothetical protein